MTETEITQFNGSEGSDIAPETAGQWTQKYREQNPEKTLAHFFGYEILQKILKQDGCKGIRFYYGVDNDGQPQLLAVGANAEQNDQLDGECIVADDSSPEPPCSSIPNVLNGYSAIVEPD